jgi:hypothetical protein
MLHREIHPMFSVVVTACHVGEGRGVGRIVGNLIREIDQFFGRKNLHPATRRLLPATPFLSTTMELLAIHHSPYQSNLNPIYHQIW